jgi:hypothetical protein
MVRSLVCIDIALALTNTLPLQDEATVSAKSTCLKEASDLALQSSIDFSTDSKIQSTIRDEFGSSLLITIAHRIVSNFRRLLMSCSSHCIYQ